MTCTHKWHDATTSDGAEWICAICKVKYGELGPRDMTQENYNAEKDIEELICIGKLPKPLRLAAMLEKTMQWPLHGKAADCLREMYEALQCYEAQPQQEPVAWMSPSWIDPDTRGWQSDSFESIPIEEWIPIYTTPPQRKPLTDEEIYSLADSLEIWNEDDEEWILDPNTFARAIEAAHGIKE